MRPLRGLQETRVAAREPELGPRLGDGAAWHRRGPAGETGKVGPGLRLGATLLRPAAGVRRTTGPPTPGRAGQRGSQAFSEHLLSSVRGWALQRAPPECRHEAGISAHVLSCIPAPACPLGGGGPGHGAGGGARAAVSMPRWASRLQLPSWHPGQAPPQSLLPVTACGCPQLPFSPSLSPLCSFLRFLQLFFSQSSGPRPCFSGLFHAFLVRYRCCSGAWGARPATSRPTAPA